MAHEIKYDSRDDQTQITVEIATTIAGLTDTPLEELPELYYVIDPESLERLFDRGTADLMSFTFSYQDYLVTIDGDGTITFVQQS